eukprot:m.86439 g.86439  ORF g.86439 m.86439 type:complete len:227 (-) comp12213_c0_seq1:233-913(-)
MIVARDRYLHSDGLMLPSFATIFTVPVRAQAMYSDHVERWNDRCGFDMSHLGSLSVASTFARPIHDWDMPMDAPLSTPQKVFEIDMHTGTVDDIEEIDAEEMSFTINRDDVMHGVACWFDVEFWRSRHACASSINCEKDNEMNKIVLSTDHTHTQTHWKQDLLMFDNPVRVHENETVYVSMSLSRNKIHRRHLTISLVCTFETCERSGEDGCHPKQKIKKSFKLWR